MRRAATWFPERYGVWFSAGWIGIFPNTSVTLVLSSGIEPDIQRYIGSGAAGYEEVLIDLYPNQEYLVELRAQALFCSDVEHDSTPVFAGEIENYRVRVDQAGGCPYVNLVLGGIETPLPPPNPAQPCTPPPACE